MRERGGKKASFKNGKMSVVPINNLGFSVKQLWGVFWISPMGPSLLPAVELPGKLKTLCVCVCVFIVCLLSVQLHEVSRVTAALAVRSKMRLGMQSDRKHAYGTLSHTHPPICTHMAEACFIKERPRLRDDTRAGISGGRRVLTATCRLQINPF